MTMKNHYKKGRLEKIEKSIGKNNNNRKITTKISYKKMRVPAKYADEIQKQQKCLVLNYAAVSGGSLLFAGINEANYVYPPLLSR